MMKKIISILLVVLMCFSMTACGKDNGTKNELEGTYDITVWVSESAGVTDLTKKQIERFCAENEGIVINATVEGISESESATQMITDVESGADLYCFAQDQLARLVQAGALAVLGEGASATVRELNDEGAVNAATVDGKLYCYPMTSDNGYFMYYDKSVISEDIVDDLAALVAACEANNKFFAMELSTSAWYNAAFFFATGCVSDWTAGSDGKFTSVNDTFNSAAGITALKGMQILAKSPNHVNSSGANEFAKGAAVLVSGTWSAATVKEILGDNMGVTDLPSFTVDGQTYHLGSYSGNKLVGVKPQSDATKAAVLQRLALYLTSEECQLERFELVGWGPSNLAAQSNEAVMNDPTLVALAAQSPYATPQGQIHGSWWDIEKVLGDVARDSATDAELQAGLDTYSNAINALFQLDGFIFVGAWNGWSNSDGNYKLVQDGDVLSIDVTVEESDYMGGRIVTAGDWDSDKGAAQVTVGADLINLESAGSDNNIVFNAAGTYHVTYNETTGEITIEAK